MDLRPRIDFDKLAIEPILHASLRLPKDIIMIIIDMLRRDINLYSFGRVGEEGIWSMIPKILDSEEAIQIAKGALNSGNIDLVKYVLPEIDKWHDLCCIIFEGLYTYSEKKCEILELLLNAGIPLCTEIDIHHKYAPIICNIINRLYDRFQLNLKKLDYGILLTMACINNDLRLFKISVSSYEGFWNNVYNILSDITEDNLSVRQDMFKLLFDNTPNDSINDMIIEPDTILIHIIFLYGTESKITHVLHNVIREVFNNPSYDQKYQDYIDYLLYELIVDRFKDEHPFVIYEAEGCNINTQDLSVKLDEAIKYVAKDADIHRSFTIMMNNHRINKQIYDKYVELGLNPVNTVVKWVTED